MGGDSLVGPMEGFRDRFAVSDRFGLVHLGDIPLTHGYGYALKVRRLVKQQAADLVVTRNLRVALCTTWTGIPTILDMHTPRRERREFRWLLRAPGLVGLSVISGALRDFLVEREGALLEGLAVAVCPDGARVERFADLPTPQQARAALGLPGMWNSAVLYPTGSCPTIWPAVKSY